MSTRMSPIHRPAHGVAPRSDRRRSGDCGGTNDPAGAPTSRRGPLFDDRFKAPVAGIDDHRRKHMNVAVRTTVQTGTLPTFG